MIIHSRCVCIYMCKHIYSIETIYRRNCRWWILDSSEGENGEKLAGCSNLKIKARQEGTKNEKEETWTNLQDERKRRHPDINSTQSRDSHVTCSCPSCKVNYAACCQSALTPDLLSDQKSTFHTFSHERWNEAYPEWEKTRAAGDEWWCYDKYSKFGSITKGWI